ncbi:hypothetical protein L284_09070 [Novosphingobium lindaniclasticum LE124]|uniref:Carboxylic ester hydrolase n=1 Tax=Novosphingobium lindaniclasticum LE124 TaxID=1096930 RepID=T0IYA6_9SPHN|nr:hypothetical protein L284_09070 [Novosphingobium lindaniclasticum LE124]
MVEASDFGDAAMQTAGAGSLPSETHSEDCLYLHLWTKGLDNTRRPVMVWLHGGGFWEGAPGRPVYYGDHIAQQDVVIVTVTHRLNVFGYTQLPDSWGPEYKSSGIAGILDIVAALRWVKANIEKFGGDPQNVTVFGESGGGGKLSLLLNMPAATGLFQKAIIQSGAVLSANSNEYGQALGQALTDIIGVSAGDVDALSKVDAGKIFEAQDAAIAKVRDKAPKGFFSGLFSPTVDGVELPRMPFDGGAPAAIGQIPLMIGSARNEANFFPDSATIIKETDAQFEQRVREAFPSEAAQLIPALRASYPGYKPGELSLQLITAQMFWINTVKVADMKARQPAPVFMYRFDWESLTRRNGVPMRAAHAIDVPIVFGTYDSMRVFVGPGDGPARMSQQMMPAWVAFARTGRPDCEEIPAWPRYDLAKRHTMLFNLESSVASDPLGEVRRLIAG